MNAVVRGFVVAAAFLTCVSAVEAQKAPGGKEAGLARLSMAEKADAASRFFRLAKTSEDKQLALRLLVEAADLGDAEAATELGLIFLDGAAGIPADPDLARKYLDTAIKIGSVDATFELGRALLRGDGLSRDIATGIKLLSRKRVAGSPLAARAAYELGQIHLTGGEGLKPDSKKARQYLDRAIEGGVAEARLRLGLALVTGEGLPAEPGAGITMLQDIRKEGGAGARAATAELGELYLVGASTVTPDPALARQYLEEAAAAGDQGAALRLGRALIDGKTLQRDELAGVSILSRLSSEGGRTAARAGRELGVHFLASAKTDPASAHKARFYLEGAANNGEETAKFYLGEALLTGAGLPRDLVRGEELLGEVIATANPLAAKAHFELAVNQLAVPQRAEEARAHLEASAGAGFGPARLRLGEELLSGKVIPADPNTAIKLLGQLSSEEGAAADSANLLLGEFFLTGGGGMKPNPNKARLYLEKAANDKPKVYVKLGQAELDGRLGPADGTRALGYFEKAQAAGIADAAVYTARVYLSGEPGVARNVGKGIKLLEEAANAGSLFAARDIIAVYRGDGVKDRKPDLEKARSSFEAFSMVGDLEDVLYEEKLLSIAATPGDLESDALAFNRIPLSRQADAIRRILSIEPKAAVYIAQERLKSAGLYTAGVDGIMGRGTLRAIATACSKGQAGACTKKPLTGKTLGFIVTSYPSIAVN